MKIAALLKVEIHMFRVILVFYMMVVVKANGYRVLVLTTKYWCLGLNACIKTASLVPSTFKKMDCHAASIISTFDLFIRFQKQPF